MTTPPPEPPCALRSACTCACVWAHLHGTPQQQQQQSSQLLHSRLWGRRNNCHQHHDRHHHRRHYRGHRHHPRRHPGVIIALNARHRESRYGLVYNYFSAEGHGADRIVMLSCTCQGVLTQYGNIWQRHQNQLLHVLLQKRERKIWGASRGWLSCSVCPPARINNMETFHQALWWKRWRRQVKNHFFYPPRWRRVQQNQNLHSSNFEIPPVILYIYWIYNRILIIS